MLLTWKVKHLKHVEGGFKLLVYIYHNTMFLFCSFCTLKNISEIISLILFVYFGFVNMVCYSLSRHRFYDFVLSIIYFEIYCQAKIIFVTLIYLQV